MRPYSIIYKKRNGVKLEDDEIDFMVSRYSSGELPDYQMSAFLMAAFLKGLDKDETVQLTKAMIASGRTLDLTGLPGIKVDKHSTGGVGDGTSLVLAPLVASCGAVVPMMSGRGLGHTGGTLDKLESIRGFRTDLSVTEFLDKLGDIGVAMIGQTADVAPADKKIYALRDVTATVDSISLISASIMSKKIAEGCDALLLDVKSGSGAFMKSLGGARALAQSMINIGRSFGIDVRAVVTDMNQPLGNCVGNAIELKHAIEVLKGGGAPDFVELVMELGARMVVMAGKKPDNKSARRLLLENLANGNALKKFGRIIESQGGEPGVIDEPDKYLPQAGSSEAVPSAAAGFVDYINTEQIGLAAIELGAGRRKKEDAIDLAAGITGLKKLGDKVEINEPLAVMHFGAGRSSKEAAALIAGAYKIAPEKPKPQKLIYEEL